MTNWQLLKDTLNENKQVLRNAFYHKPFGALSSTMDEYLWLLKESGYIKFQDKPVSVTSYGHKLYDQYCVLQFKIPGSLTIEEAVKIKKQPWLAWFKTYD